MKSSSWFRLAMCCGMMAGFCGVAIAQPADLKPAKPMVPTIPREDKLKDAAEDGLKVAQPERKDAPGAIAPTEMSPAQKAEMDAWSKAAEPGPMHAWLTTGVGTWDARVTMMFPGEPSTESTGTMTIEMMLGGRYQRGLFSGNLMGMPFQGIALTGYNNISKAFEGTWMDSFTTAIIVSKGAMEGDKLVMTGDMQDPMTGKTIKQKQVVTFTGNDKMVAEFFNEMEGKQVPVMTISYTRAAAKPAAESRPAEKSTMDTVKDEGQEDVDALKKKLPGGK